MFFSKSLAVVATLAFGAISSVAAIPAPSQSNNVLARCGCKSPAGIITDVTASVQVYTGQLSALPYSSSTYALLINPTTEALVAADVTVDAITPLVKGITGVLVDATAEINLLVGAEADVILASADGSAQVTVTVVAQLIAALIVVSPLLYLDGRHLLIILNIS